MPVNPLYAVGTTLVHRQDPGRTAEIIATKTLNGIEHYLIEVSPNHIHASPFWLSGFGLNRDFAPRGRRRGGDGADVAAATGPTAGLCSAS